MSGAVPAVRAFNRPLDHFLECLRVKGCDYRQVGDGRWMAQCPAHDDRTPSLSITEGEKGQVVVNCFAHCETKAVLDSLGLDWTELYVVERNEERRQPAPVTNWIGELQRIGVVSPADLLEGLVRFVRRYVVVTKTQADTIALWIAHTHAFAAAEASLYLSVESPEKHCGKTLLLRVVSLVVRNQWRVITPSEAVVYRKIEQDRPTLLLDEVDTIFGGNKDYEPLRAVLNAGNEPDTVVPRCGGSNRDELHEFAVFCPKVLAGIGKLPDTVADRSIRIEMKRKKAGEKVTRFRRREAGDQADALREALAAWAEENIGVLAEARPDVPVVLDDRAADGWEPLLAIADHSGGDWPTRARAAAEALSNGEADDDSLGVRLLRDTQIVFDQHDDDRLSSADLLHDLCEMEEAPWGDWYGKPLSARRLATLLRPYGIHSRTVRLNDESTAKGFQREQFEESWSRYLPSPPSQNVTTSQPAYQAGLEAFSIGNNDDPVTDSEPPDSAPQAGCDLVTDRSPEEDDEAQREQEAGSFMTDDEEKAA